MQKVIEREITINASKERIYDVIANPEKVVLWFPETLEGNYNVGDQPIFGFGEQCRSQIYVASADPYHYFAYRWVPGANYYLGDVLSVPNTLVEFRIIEISEEQCKVILTESGFENLPAQVIEESFKQNSGGWDFMLNRLQNYFEG